MQHFFFAIFFEKYLANSKIFCTFARLYVFIRIMIKEKIQNLLGQVESLQANTAEEVEALRIKYLSKKGLVTELFNDFREVPKEEKREIGQLLNQLRQTYEERINALREQAALQATKAEADAMDLTRTPDPIALGTRHPLSLVREQIIDIFSRVGFTVAEGPEVTWQLIVF